MEILRLNLGYLHVLERPWPVHGFVVLHPRLGAVLIDTGCGGPEQILREYRVVNRSVADALAEHDLSPADIQVVINTHLHFDHCGQNAVFPHARLCVQRKELERVRREGDPITQWLDTANARFELFDGDVVLADDLRAVATPGHTVGHQSVIAQTGLGTEVFIGDVVLADDLRAVATPGHTVGHQSVIVRTVLGTEVFIGDAAYTRAVWEAPGMPRLPPGQADDPETWRTSLDGLRDLAPARVHFCHDAS